MTRPKDARTRWPDPFWEEGFDGRIFLTEAEWRTYLRRPPERYPRRTMPRQRVCSVCGKRESSTNPLQVAHRIRALNGVRYLGLTPEFLDDPKRLVWAHRVRCNRAVELDFASTLQYLRELGVKRLPSFLPESVRRAWKDHSRKQARRK